MAIHASQSARPAIQTVYASPWWDRWISRCGAHPYRVIASLAGLCLLTYLALLRVPRLNGLLIGSDGVLYFAELRSLVIDHDLRMANEMAHLLGTVPPGAAVPKYTIGTAVLWLPFYLIAHVVTLSAHALGAPVSPDGYGRAYQLSVCIGTLFYGYLGALLMFRLCRDVAGPGAALLSTVTIWFGWNVVYYMVFESAMSHIDSMFATCCILTWWRFGPKGRNVVYWGVLGLLLGLAAMVHPQDALLGAIPLVDRCLRYRWALLHRRDLWRGLLCAGAFGGGIVLGYVPQFVASWVVYGSPLTTGYAADGESFHWTSPQIIAVLFSTWHGLFAWHPFLLLAVAGLWVMWRIRPVEATALSIGFALQVWLVASWGGWHQGDAFGSRMLISCAPIFALGLACLLDEIQRRRIWLPWVVVVPALLWNALFILQYRLGAISRSDAITWQQLTIDKLTIVFRALPLLNHFLHLHHHLPIG